MTASSDIDSEFLHEQLSQTSPDPLRQMLTTFINTLMSAEVNVHALGHAARRAPGGTTPLSSWLDGPSWATARPPGASPLRGHATPHSRSARA